MKFVYKEAEDHIGKVKETLPALSSRLEKLRECSECTEYNHPEDVLHLPFEKEDIDLAKQISKEKGEDLKWIYVVGIGGANLGAQAVTLALRYSVPHTSPKILFFDTIDPPFLSHIKETTKSLKKKDEFIVLVISKSGETIETLTNAKIVSSILEEKFSNIEDRVIVLTKENSELWKAVGNDVQKIPLRENIGDRYSVFSIIGLLPLAFGGMDMDGFTAGARESLKECLNEDLENNPAALSAAHVHNAHIQGMQVRDFFFFVPEMEYVGKWSRQLMAESLGKEGKGITPTVSIGTTDLHSMAQLYLGGPMGTCTTFINIESALPLKIESSKVFESLLPAVTGKESEKIISSIYSSYKDSYEKSGGIYSEILLPDLSAHSIGQYFQFLIIETLLLADLWAVNPYNQPAVEEYKKAARDLLL